MTRELETGFDASLLKNRLSFEFTYYNKLTMDGILTAVTASPSSGFPGKSVHQHRSVQQSGLELALEGAPVTRNDFRLNLRGSLATNRNRIDVLGQDTPIPNTGIGQLTGAYNAAGLSDGILLLPEDRERDAHVARQRDQHHV